ncbi:MAG: PVC-type heme-binding CxxCH protein [Pirellulales bacterium]
MVALALCGTATAAEPAASASPASDPPPTVRETPLAPADELATFHLADPRLTVELVAEEPQLDSPVAICWDADGRMFVAEMIDYPLGPTAGRIRLLEDRDGDGRYEHATVFADGLRFPNGLLAAQGGLFVTAAPDLLYLRDADGDGSAEQKRVVFTGFGEGNQQLRANGLTWGLDNFIYGANGRSDGAVRRPDEPADKGVSIRGRDFRFLPDGSRFEATSGQSQFGQASDDWGNRFLSWNTIPVRHALFDQQFLDRNPRLSSCGVRDIADPQDTGRVFPLSPRPQTFNRERTDYYNALCGLTIFRGDALGKEYLGSAFAGESLTNLVHRRLLAPDGPTFVSRRGEHDREFLASDDPWFHPVYMTTGPDGALYIVDFYRRWVEHPAFVPEKLRASVDWRKGSGHGRIWKVSRRELTWPPRPAPKMSGQSISQVARHIDNPNGWLRDTAQRVLVERRDPSAAPFLRAIVLESRIPQAKVNALGALAGLDLLDDSTLLRAIEDADGHVRQVAIRLAAPRMATSLPLRDAALRLADFPHVLVRFELARSLAALAGPEKTAALVTLADLEADDRWTAAAIVGGIGGAGPQFLAQLLEGDKRWRRKPSSTQIWLLTEASARIASADPIESVARVLALAAGEKPGEIHPGDLAVLSGLAQGLSDRGTSLRSQLAEPDGAQRRQRAAVEALVAAARKLAVDDRQSLDHRLLALDVLSRLDAQAGKIVVELTDPRHDQSLQTAAAGAIASADAATAEAMLASWPTRTTATRRALVAGALRSATATAALVAALEGDHISARELDTSTRDALRAVRDAGLQARIDKLLGEEPSGDRAAVLARYEPALKTDGDRLRGAALFARQCLACHSVQGRGQRVGPDLSGVGARPREAVLADVLDPNRQVSPDFVAYTLVTTEGQVLSGLLVSETAASVTLRRAEGAQDFVPRAQIEQLRATGKSLMPEGMEQNLSPQDMADLLDFLARPDAGLFSVVD